VERAGISQPGYLGSHERFRHQFTVPIERYNDDQQAAELRRLVQPFLLRRLKSDPTVISDLPEKNEMVVYCSMTREQATSLRKPPSTRRWPRSTAPTASNAAAWC
jgi:SNF2 family DNA or RNA helicase